MGAEAIIAIVFAVVKLIGEAAATGGRMLKVARQAAREGRDPTPEEWAAIDGEMRSNSDEIARLTGDGGVQAIDE